MEFNHLKGAGVPRTPAGATIDLAISNDHVWQQVCNQLGWRFMPTV
jgi:hypothetical protein